MRLVGHCETKIKWHGHRRPDLTRTLAQAVDLKAGGLTDLDSCRTV